MRPFTVNNMAVQSFRQQHLILHVGDEVKYKMAGSRRATNLKITRFYYTSTSDPRIVGIGDYGATDLTPSVYLFKVMKAGKPKETWTSLAASLKAERTGKAKPLTSAIVLAKRFGTVNLEVGQRYNVYFHHDDQITREGTNVLINRITKIDEGIYNVKGDNGLLDFNTICPPMVSGGMAWERRFEKVVAKKV